MSADPYSATVRALFSAPAHAGDLNGGESVALDDQEIRLQLSATAEDGVITAMRFRAWGCPHVIAAAESACASLEGRPVPELLDFAVSGLMKKLPVPVEKTGRILVLEDAIRSLGQRFGVGS
jgi:NifU-like protein involved in Fe-S cluster formation